MFEAGVLVFHPKNVHIGDGVYIGHRTMLKGYHERALTIGAGTWIGSDGFFHAAGGLHIRKNVGPGPPVKLLTSRHA